MRTLLEEGLAAFVAAGLEAAEIECPVHTATSADGLEPQSYLVVKVDGSEGHLAALSVWTASVMAASPRRTGYEADHGPLCDFLRRLFAPAVAPALPVNAAHLSEFIAEATDDDLSCRGFSVEGWAEGDREGWQVDVLRLRLGIFDHQLGGVEEAALESDGEITV